MSNTNNATVDQNTIFAIGSNTKVFTAILLADMVEEGLIILSDPIDKYLPFNIIVSQYNGHKITLKIWLPIRPDYLNFHLIIAPDF